MKNYERDYDRYLDCPSEEDIVLGQCEECDDDVMFSECHYRNDVEDIYVHEECIFRFIRKEYNLELVSEYSGEM